MDAAIEAVSASRLFDNSSRKELMLADGLASWAKRRRPSNVKSRRPFLVTGLVMTAGSKTRLKSREESW